MMRCLFDESRIFKTEYAVCIMVRLTQQSIIKYSFCQTQSLTARRGCYKRKQTSKNETQKRYYIHIRETTIVEYERERLRNLL